MNMKNLKLLVSILLLSFIISGNLITNALPERPSSARVYYEIEYFPCRLVSMLVTTMWDVPTGAFQGAVKNSIGGTKMVARNLGNEDGIYEMVAGGVVGGTAGALGGAVSGASHGLVYGIHHGFVGYPSPHTGSHDMLFQGRGFVVPYDDDY